jgi:hypothetical protein
VVECTALEMRHRCKPIGGSNPSLSARGSRQAIDETKVFLKWSDLVPKSVPKLALAFRRSHLRKAACRRPQSAPRERIVATSVQYHKVKFSTRPLHLTKHQSDIDHLEINVSFFSAAMQ